MTSGHFAHHYTTRRSARIPHGFRSIHGKMFRAAEGSRVEDKLWPADIPPPWAEDLLRVARAAYLADRRSKRGRAADGWTRTIALSIQLIDAHVWSGQAESILAALLRILTADRWHLQFQPGAAPHGGVQQVTGLTDSRAEEVALFSGGLDSTAYAAERATTPGGPLLLVSYHDPGIKSQQEEILRVVDRMARRPITHKPYLRQMTAGEESLDSSSRSRGLLFLATAIYLAAAHGVREVAIPENGQLAVNPALTASRPAACSTRSVHPYTLHLVNQLIESLGGDVRVVNPLLSATKGEVCRRAHAAGLPLATLMETVSCGHSPCFYSNSTFLHCGYCYPCLIRQSGLLAGVGRDDTPYQTDVWRLPVRDRKAEQRRAIHAWLAADFGPRDLAADMPLPPGLTPAELLPVLRRGREELRSLFRHRAMLTDSSGR